MAARGSRLEKSVYTFGPVGRVLWTLGGLTVLYLLFSPLVHALRAGLINSGIGVVVPLFKAVAGVILLIWIWPRYLRYVWRPASIAGNELTQLRDQMRREAALQARTAEQSEAPLLPERSGPTRW